MTARAEIALQRLGLAYGVELMASGDVGFTQAKKYDLEVWAPGAEDWLEVELGLQLPGLSGSTHEHPLAAGAGGKAGVLHTLNGSGLALARTVAAIMEVYQDPDGSVRVPDVLRPRLGERIGA